MPNKYHARRTWSTHLQRWFDSAAEMQRGHELMLLHQAGAIDDLVYQPRFVLAPKAYAEDGGLLRPIVYVADFAYREHGRRIVEDVKGAQTAVFRLKLNLFRRQYRDLELRLLEP